MSKKPIKPGPAPIRTPGLSATEVNEWLMTLPPPKQAGEA